MSRFLQNLLKRPWRLLLLAFIMALVFPVGRFLIVIALVLALGYYAILSYREERRVYIKLISLIVAIFALLHIYSLIQMNRVRSFSEFNSPVSLERVPDGSYKGEGEGLRGPIKVQVTASGHRIEEIGIIEHREAVTALKGLGVQFIGRDNTDFTLIPATIHGAPQAAQGFKMAVEDALLRSLPGYPRMPSLASMTFFFTANRPSRTMWNTLAILFILLLVIDYSLQPIFNRDTGQSLNCYNCQTCVGACPVKNVEGDPYPMTMVLMARLGDYERVRYLSRYCVGCSRCAGKCPAGISGPSVAAACNILLRSEQQGRN